MVPPYYRHNLERVLGLEPLTLAALHNLETINHVQLSTSQASLRKLEMSTVVHGLLCPIA